MAKSALPGLGFSPPAHTIARGVRQRTSSARSVLEEALVRIAALNSELAAFCTLSIDQARMQAEDIDRRLDAGEPVGPLAGVPVGIKDLIPTRGIRTTFGSLLYQDHVPELDDIVVERLRRADAVIVGKTNAAEFGYGPVAYNAIFPSTRNCWGTDLTPGGSSAGSAVAVAAGMLPLTIGSDGGGSIRVPAAFCGVVGFKPSFGRVPIYPSCRDERMPGVSGWESLEHFGPLATCVRDVRLLMSVIAGPDNRDRHSVPRGAVKWTRTGRPAYNPPVIAYSATLGFAACDPEVDAIAQLAVAELVRLGWIQSPTLPKFPNAQAAFATIVAMETDRKGVKMRAAEMGVTCSPSLAAVLDRTLTTDAIEDALIFRKRLAREFGAFFSRHDFLLTPTTAIPAYPAGMLDRAVVAGREVGPENWAPFSSFANLTGAPAISVPVGLTSSGLPVGLQIMGRNLDDDGVLWAAEVLEALHPFRRPPRT